MRRVGIVALAKDLGINIGSVSRALNGKPGVSEKLRVRVHKRAKELNYQPNNFARALLTNRTCSIGVVGKMGDTSFFDNPFWGRVLAGVEQRAREAGYDLLVGASQTPDSRAAVLPRFLKERRVDGVIALNELPEEAFQFIDDCAMPCAQVDFLSSRRYPSVMSDHAGGASLVARHFVALGHKKLLFFGDPWCHPSRRECLKGFQKAAKGKGVQVVSPNRHEVANLHSGLEGYRRLLLDLLRRHPDITGIFFQNDTALIRAKTILMNRGVKIPDDLSLVGFDDIALATETYPPLTTVRVPMQEMGRAAFDILWKQSSSPVPVSGSRKPAPSQVFPVELIVRGTTAPPRRGKLRL